MAYITLDRQDPDFVFVTDGVVLVPRASIKVSTDCPDYYRTIIADAFNKGWLQPIANMRGTEYTMELLKK